MRQRLGLAQALLGEPKLLLLDEPTVGLDPIATQDLYLLIDRLRQRGTSIILCSHVLPGVEAHINRAAILAKGRLQAAGSLAHLRAEAGLPVRIRASGISERDSWLQRWAAAGHSARGLSESSLEVVAVNGHKLVLLRQLLGEGSRRTSRSTSRRWRISIVTTWSAPATCAPRRSAMNQVWNIARKELSDGLRNRWLLAISLLFAVLAVGIAWLGAAASGQLGFTSIPATIASLASLATFLMPLIALLLAYDAIVGEDEGGT